MKKIDRDAALAFKNKKRFSSANTKVYIENNEAKMYLFGNLIAKTKEGETYIHHCNWRTVTTRNRLNALGAWIRLSKGSFIVNEEFEWDDDNWLKL
jgi:ribosome biogenesis protein Nip4